MSQVSTTSSDWMMVDERAERFRPLFNDEYSRDALVGLCHRHASIPSAQRIYDDAALERPAAASIRSFHILFLQGDSYTSTCGPIYPGASHLPAKVDSYNTTRGYIGLEEYNRLAREMRPPALDPKFRHLCETWVKYHAGEPLADELYKVEQSSSRLLKGKGSTLRRADIEKLRAA